MRRGHAFSSAVPSHLAAAGLPEQRMRDGGGARWAEEAASQRAFPVRFWKMAEEVWISVTFWGGGEQ